ncbi:MAG: ABC transporter ATP-binding protein [Chloroflexi bacterium]|nr:ABC transporter ATP-binding protein [Chloroflexota bacterium]
MAMLDVQDLKMYYRLRRGAVQAVDGVSFTLDQGDTLGLVGESGCGKTSAALALLRLLPRNAEAMGGRILFEGRDVLRLPEMEMRKVRWARIAMIFQAAMNALNPVQKVGDQLAEAVLLHKQMPRAAARDQVARYFEVVGLPASRMDNYPFEFSGGMRQRAIIAMSLICQPALIIADEPTTALDVVVQDQILRQIEELQKEIGFGMLVISHDLSVIAETCRRVAVMYGGQIVEYGDTAPIFTAPRHPYTIALLRSFPSLRGPLTRLEALQGNPPDLIDPPSGCRFHPRCRFSQHVCAATAPPYVETAPGHFARCHFAGDSSPFAASTPSAAREG